MGVIAAPLGIGLQGEGAASHSVLQIIMEYYLAFPDEGTLDIKVWEDIGYRLRSLQDSGVSIGTQNINLGANQDCSPAHTG